MAFDIGLPQNYIVVYDYELANVWNLTIQKSKYAFASVYQIYNGCLTTAPYDFIMYEIAGRIAFIESGQEYFIIRETSIVLYEHLAPPAP